MTTAGPTPQIPDVIRQWWASRERGIHTALPGKVTEYDAATQTATIAPQVQQAVQDADGFWVHEDLPEIFDVPVMSAGSGQAAITFPIAVGSTGLLIFCERDIGQWRYTGQASSPGDQRCHSLAGAVFLPGLRPVSSVAAANPTHVVVALPGATQMLVGESATQFVALANLVLSELNDIRSKFDTHTHLYIPGSNPSVATAVPAAAMGPASSVASTTLKAE